MNHLLWSPLYCYHSVVQIDNPLLHPAPRGTGYSLSARTGSDGQIFRILAGKTTLLVFSHSITNSLLSNHLARLRGLTNLPSRPPAYRSHLWENSEIASFWGRLTVSLRHQ